MNIYKELREKMEKVRDEEIQLVEKIFCQQKAEIYASFRNQLKKMQEICPHENTEVKEGFDYHKRETWHETYCMDCGKLLKRV